MAVLKHVRTIGVDDPVDVLTLDEAKGELELASARQDDRLQRIVSAVSHALENATGGPIGRVTQRFYYSRAPVKGDLVLVEASPVHEISGIGYLDESGAERAVDVVAVRATGVWDNPLPGPAEPVRVRNVTADGWDIDEHQTLEWPFWIEAEVGWDPIPPMAREAAMKVVQQAAIHRALTIDFEQFDAKTIVQTFINQYRRAPAVQFVGAR